MNPTKIQQKSLYEGIVKKTCFFMRRYYELWSIRCTRMHKFHFSSDARERNGVVFRIINSGVYRPMAGYREPKKLQTGNVDFCRTSNNNAPNGNFTC